MGFIIFGIVFFILSTVLRKQVKKAYEKLYNARMDKLHAYSAGGRKPLLVFIWGIPKFSMTREEALEHYWDLLHMKPDVMQTFYFTHFTQTSMVSLVSVVLGVVLWIA